MTLDYYSLLKIKTFEPTRINDKFDHMGNIVNPNPNFPNIYVNIPTPKQENQNANGEKDNKEEKQQEKKQCVTANQILVFANAAYYVDDELNERLQEGNEQNSKLFKVYEDKRLASKASVITTKNGVASFNIAGTADPTEEGLENYMADMLNNVLIGTNNLQGILKDRIDWYRPGGWVAVETAN